MRPRKNSGAARLGIEFTGNPDALDYCEKNTEERRKKRQDMLNNPGKYMIGSLG
jgi:hypothetical protein